jgi:seryl-tRNA synthetase
MRDEVAQLEAEHAELRKRKEQAAHATHTQAKSEDDASLMTLYKRLAALKISLREQNVAMKETIKEFDRFNERLQHIVRSDEDQVQHCQHCCRHSSCSNWTLSWIS